MVSGKLFTSQYDNWGTPPEVFVPLEKEFGPFDLDAAAAKENAKAPRFFSIEDNGLSKEWTGRVFLNPPYGKDIGNWMQKAYYAAYEGTASVVVCVVPARVDTAWWHDWVVGRGEVRFLRGRVRFLAPGGGLKMSSAPFPTAIVVYRASHPSTARKDSE